ncbi:CoA pyrophosphatase [Micropruina sp.]|uniref:NUDIX hydrolase n=1 Tax=Micropruina sp. TaxID=2737536 RepID=UPI002628BE0E|nr:CoA pyrophosphatase [Micropruina sp.]
MTTVDAERLRAALAGPEAAARVAGRAAQGGRPAAVLIALAEHAEGTRIVLVEKDARLRTHAGQVAFPGGSIEASDASAVAGALREADEEVGLAPGEVEVLGVLPPAYVRASDFAVTAVVGRWPTPRPLAPVDVTEIAAVHSVAVDVLVDPANRLTWTHPAGFSGPGFVVGELFIWGFTAYLLDGLFDLAGWTVPWDVERLSDIPERFRIGRRR